MRKRFQLTDLDCANCADRIERSVKKLNGVNDCVVNFMSQKILLDYSGDTDAVLDDVQRAITRINKDCTIVR